MTVFKSFKKGKNKRYKVRFENWKPVILETK